jgi:hypothetical protein
VGIFTGPAWRIRDLLLPHLKNVAVSRREDFARVLYLGGYDVEVPGIHVPSIDVVLGCI